MKLKKLLALLLALVMVFTLAACGDDVSNDDDDDDDDDEESTSMSSDPTGTTDSTDSTGKPGDKEDPKDPPPTTGNDDPIGPVVPAVDTVVGKWEAAVKTTGETMGTVGFDGAFDLMIVVTFDADGDYLMAVDADKTLATMDSAFDKALADYVLKTLIEMAGSEEEADAVCKDQYNMSAAEFAQSSVVELKGMLKEMMVEMATAGEYELVDGKLYMDGKEIAVSKAGETLKLSVADLEMDGVDVEELELQLISADPEDVNPDNYGEEELLPPAEAIVGQWECMMFLDGPDMGLDDFDGLIAYGLNFTFNADGSFSMVLDEDTLLESAKVFEEDLVKYMVDMMYDQLTASGMTKEEADEAMIATYGKGVEEYCKEEVAKQDLVGNMSAALAATNVTGTYTIDGDKLTMTDTTGSAVEVTFELLDNDCFQWDGTGSAFEKLTTVLGEEYMFLFRKN